MSSTTISAASGKRSRLANFSRSSIDVHAEPGVVRDTSNELADVTRAEDVDGRRRLDRLDEHFHLAAADQSRLRGEVVGELVAHRARLARLQCFARLPQRFVLVAAAADGADDAAIGVDEHLGADALRRRAVGRHDRHERDLFAGFEGLAQRREHLVIHFGIIATTVSRWPEK